MGWLENHSRRRAVQRMARALPPILHQNWGASEFYSAGQVERALQIAGLAGRHDAIAYAALLTRGDYLATKPKLHRPVDYDEVHSLVADALAGASWPNYRHEAMSNHETAGRYGLGGGL